MLTLQSEARSKPNEGLAAPLRRMQEFARNIARVSKESKLEVNEEDYVASFKVGLMDAVHSWCRGAKFSDICKVRIPVPFVHDLKSLLTLAPLDVGRFRRFAHSSLPQVAGAVETNGDGCESHRLLRAGREVHQVFRNARTEVLYYFQSFFVSLDLREYGQW